MAFATISLSGTPHQFFDAPEEYLLGDKIYRSTRRCVTPYREPQASQRRDGCNFNCCYAHPRAKIEHSSALQKRSSVSSAIVMNGDLRSSGGYDSGYGRIVVHG